SLLPAGSFSLPFPQPLFWPGLSLSAVRSSSLTSCSLFLPYSFSGILTNVRCIPHDPSRNGTSLSHGHASGSLYTSSETQSLPVPSGFLPPSLHTAPYP